MGDGVGVGDEVSVDVGLGLLVGLGVGVAVPSRLGDGASVSSGIAVGDGEGAGVLRLPKKNAPAPTIIKRTKKAAIKILIELKLVLFSSFGAKTSLSSVSGAGDIVCFSTGQNNREDYWFCQVW